MTHTITTQPTLLNAKKQPDSYEEYMVEVCCDFCEEWCVPGMSLMLGAAIYYWYVNGEHHD